jgi:hypothetical protein
MSDQAKSVAMPLIGERIFAWFNLRTSAIEKSKGKVKWLTHLTFSGIEHKSLK